MTGAADPGPDAHRERSTARRGGLLRRLLVFQFKLALDGLRDVILSPVSFLAVLYGVLTRGDDAEEPFERLLAFGRRSDHWIDLFEAGAREGVDTQHADSGETGSRRPGPGDATAAGASADAMFEAVERAVREELASGGGLAAVEARIGALRRGRPADAAVDDAAAGDAAASSLDGGGSATRPVQ